MLGTYVSMPASPANPAGPAGADALRFPVRGAAGRGGCRARARSGPVRSGPVRAARSLRAGAGRLRPAGFPPLGIRPLGVAGAAPAGFRALGSRAGGTRRAAPAGRRPGPLHPARCARGPSQAGVRAGPTGGGRLGRVRSVGLGLLGGVRARHDRAPSADRNGRVAATGVGTGGHSGRRRPGVAARPRAVVAAACAGAAPRAERARPADPIRT